MCTAPKARGSLSEPTLVYFCVYFASNKHSVSQIFCLFADFFLQRRQEPVSHLQPLAPGRLASSIWCSHRSSLGSVPDQGTKTPLQATARCGHRRSASRAPSLQPQGPTRWTRPPSCRQDNLGPKGWSDLPGALGGGGRARGSWGRSGERTQPPDTTEQELPPRASCGPVSCSLGSPFRTSCRPPPTPRPTAMSSLPVHTFGPRRRAEMGQETGSCGIEAFSSGEAPTRAR